MLLALAQPDSAAGETGQGQTGQQATAACRIDAAQPAVSVRGLVLDPSDAAVAEAVILAECGGTTVEARTGRDGRFTMPLAPGRYQLQIVKTGFEIGHQELTVTVEGGSPATFRLTLDRLQENVTVVSAAANARTLRDAPASVSVITSADLETRPIRDVSEALALVEGVTTRRSGNQVAGIQIRGLDSTYTLMLIDGRRVNATSTSFRGNDYDTGWVPAAAIERIEVVRGPMSSLYGSDAIGGVVNIITRRVGQAWAGSLNGNASLQENRNAGDAWVVNGSLTGPIVRDVLGLKMYGGFDRRDADGTVNPAQSNGGAPLPGFAVNDNRFVATDATWVADSHNDLTVHYDGSRRDHGGFLLKRHAFAAEHKGRWGTRTSELRFYGDQIRNLVGTVTGEINPNRARSAVAEGKINLPFLTHVVTVGGQWRREALFDPANLAGLPGTPTYGVDPTTSVRQGAAFAEADFGLGSRLRVTVGDRLDHHENFGSNNSPRAYAVYHLTNAVTLKGGVSRAFRAPTLLQNSPTWGSPSCGSATTGCFIIGSRDLEPETSTSAEASAQLDRGGWGAGVTYYRNDLKNMIDITSRTANVALAPTYPNFIGFLPAGAPGNGRPIFRYENVQRVRTEGLEASVRVAPSTAWRLRVSYAYLDAKNRSGAAPLPLVYRPAHTFNAMADWLPAKALTISGIVRSNGSQYVSVPASGTNLVTRDGYAIVDLSAAYRLHPRLTVRGGALNVGNMAVARDTSLDFNEDGRRYFIGLSTQF
jgi:outer membrane receptor for ferrienterochelin and colicins